MKYMVAGLICIFLVLCAGIVTHIVEVGLPSDDSIWMANLSTEFLFNQQVAETCSSDENLAGDSLDDLDDVIVNMGRVEFVFWVGTAQDRSDVCPPTVWRPLPKIPITGM